MGPEIEVGEKLKSKMEPSKYKSNGMFAKELEDELMKFTTNHEEYKLDVHLGERADAGVNMMECTRSGGNQLVETECKDATESSSSFDDCCEGVENVGEPEVLSDFHGDDLLTLDFDGFGEIFRTRKKKPTAHWRSFIRPLMWRCKWIELQIKKLEDQAQKFDRKLEQCNQQGGSEVLRRKKRRRDELTKDVAAYMSHHNLFSYYENRKCFPRDALMDENPATAIQEVNIDDDEYWGHDEPLCVETVNDDNSFEHVFRKIDFLQSRVHELKSRVDKVKSENGDKFSCSDNSSLPVAYNALWGSPLNTDDPPYNGDRIPVGTYIASQLMSEFNMDDLLVPERALMNHGDANGSMNHVYFGDAFGIEEDEVLIDNRRVKDIMQSFEEVMEIEPIQQPSLVLNNGSTQTRPVPLVLPTDEQSPLKVRSLSNLSAPKSKSKKGRRRKGDGP